MPIPAPVRAIRLSFARKWRQQLRRSNRHHRVKRACAAAKPFCCASCVLSRGRTLSAGRTARMMLAQRSGQPPRPPRRSSRPAPRLMAITGFGMLARARPSLQRCGWDDPTPPLGPAIASLALGAHPCTLHAGEGTTSREHQHGPMPDRTPGWPQPEPASNAQACVFGTTGGQHAHPSPCLLRVCRRYLGPCMRWRSPAMPRSRSALPARAQARCQHPCGRGKVYLAQRGGILHAHAAPSAHTMHLNVPFHASDAKSLTRVSSHRRAGCQAGHQP